MSSDTQASETQAPGAGAGALALAAMSFYTAVRGRGLDRRIERVASALEEARGDARDARRSGEHGSRIDTR